MDEKVRKWKKNKIYDRKTDERKGKRKKKW